MKRSAASFIAITAVLLLTLCGAGCMTGETHQDAGITGEDLEAYVHDAAAYARSVGKAEALATFADKNGPFVRGNLYVYAYDFNNTLLAHPFLPEEVGTDRTTWTTANGLRFVAAANDIAGRGGGYAIYMYPEPAGGREIDEAMKNLYEVKLGYVEKVDETWWIGSGIYLSDYIDGTTGELPSEVTTMTALTRSAVVYAHKNGTAALLSEIDKQEGQFTDGNLYLYAYTFEGTLLAHPYLCTDTIGTDLSDYVGPYGVMPVKRGAEIARNGGGFYVFGWKNPARGDVPELKLGYVLPVNRNCWVGSGLYLSDIFDEDDGKGD